MNLLYLVDDEDIIKLQVESLFCFIRIISLLFCSDRSEKWVIDGERNQAYIPLYQPCHKGYLYLNAGSLHNQGRRSMVLYRNIKPCLDGG
jgi:hypothetical protein